MKNDAYTDLFYEILGEKYRPDGPWSCFLFHGRYDVPVKGLDKAWMEGSEEVYEYLICAISPGVRIPDLRYQPFNRRI